MQPDAETSSLPAVVIRALSAFADGARLLRARPACFCLKRGRTNDTWRVTGDGADWVVRSFDPLIAALPPLSAPHAPNVAADGASSSRSQQHA